MAASTPVLQRIRPGRLFEASAQETERAKPFLKWAGGKTRLLSSLRRWIPSNGFNTYFEPFLGGGAFFFDLSPSAACLGDSNPELINCYEMVRDRPDELLEALAKLRVTKAEFYKIRASRPQGMKRVDRAARLIYLNKACYNGLYRVNKQGAFNTPYGRRSKVTLVNHSNLYAASRCLKNATLYCGDYEAVLAAASKGDFVYFDPPYIPVGKYSDFKRYTKDQFNGDDHERLADVFRKLAARGCFVLLSNSLNPRTASLYSDFEQRRAQMPRFVNCKGDGRGSVGELIISNYKPTHA